MTKTYCDVCGGELPLHTREHSFYVDQGDLKVTYQLPGSTVRADICKECIKKKMQKAINDKI